MAVSNAPASRPPLDRDRLAAVPGWSVEVVEAVGSTNAVVAERAAAGEPSGLVITTEHQYAGRGRLDRGWQMPPRSAIAMSALVHPQLSAMLWGWIPLAAGMAVVRAIEPVTAGLKWPNDVLIDGRKVSGILVERIETPTGPSAVIGIGLNVWLSAEELPVPTATSLAMHSADPIDRTGLIIDILAGLREVLSVLEADPAAVGRDYPAYSATIGREVTVSMPDGSRIEGMATGIAEDGRLIVETDRAEVLAAAGDVIHAMLT